MSDILNTKKRDYQYNGPVESSDYNSRIEENYKDLVFLYNKANLLDNKLAQAFERVIKDNISLTLYLTDLESRIKALENTSKQISLSSYSQLDYATFAATSFAINSTNLLTFDPTYNIVTLPRVSSSSFSKLKFANATSGQVVPDFFKARVDNSYAGVDTANAVIDTTPIYNCILDYPDKVWKRNIVAASGSASSAQMMLYVKIPTESAGSSKTNMIKLNPYPAFGSDIVSIEYTTKSSPSLSDSDGWYPLNRYGYYDGVTSAIGKVAPGGWSTAGADSIKNAGPMAFIFADLDITAIRIKFNQRNYTTETNKNIYTYGLSDLDIRYDKYLPTGKMLIKYTPPSGTISQVTSVVPKIYNIPQSMLNTAFSYRIIYKSGSTYTLSNPGSSNSIWIEVTLNMLDDNTPPVLTDLIITYS